DVRKVSEASDVFSLGAIAFHLFASRPPASSPTDLAAILRDQKGLSIASVLDGAGKKLEELILWSTHPDVHTRTGSVEDFLILLEVAMGDDKNARLHEEARALRSIHSEFIVAIEDELVINGRTALVLQKAGDKTLAAMLRSEGVPGLEMLARYGDDLLSAVSSL